MPDEESPRKDAPEDDLEAEIAELEEKLRESVAGKPLTQADEERIAELAEKLEVEDRLDVFFERQDQGIEKMEAIAEGFHVEKEAPALDDDLEAKLKAIEEKARIARTRRGTGLSSPEKSREMKSDREAAKGLGIGLSVAYTIIGLPMVGFGIGWLLDSRTDSNVFKPAFGVGGSVLGIVFAVIILNREQNRK